MKFQLLKQAVVGPQLPATVFDNLYSARENDLKVILYVLQKGEIDILDIGRALDISTSAIQSSLLFWTDKGLILCEENQPERPKKRKLLSSQEILQISKSNPEIDILVTQLQKIYGQALNERITNTFISLHLQENIPVDVILVLTMHFAPAHSKGPAYTARVIQNLYEKKGITSADKAEEHIRLLEKRDSLYTAVCGVFNLDKEKLTSSEKTVIDAWGERLNMSMEMIKAAFEAAEANANIKYCNGILKSWSQKGYKTAKDIQEEFTFTNLSGRNIDRDEDIILQGMNIVPVFDKGE